MSDTKIEVDLYRTGALQQATDSEYSYRGLRIHALTGLHEVVGKLIQQFFRPSCIVCDIAAGTGAMSARLLDLGFQVRATDYVGENFRLHDRVAFESADLNLPFGSMFDGTAIEGIVATEIIEHIENPRHFSRECFRMLANGGHMIVTTPNIDSSASKAVYSRSGEHLWFGQQDYKINGHITPLYQAQLLKIFAEAGFELVYQCSHGVAGKWLNGSPRMKILASLLGLLSPTPKPLGGDIYVAVFQKPRPEI